MSFPDLARIIDEQQFAMGSPSPMPQYQKPLLELAEGVYVRPESVQSIEALDEARVKGFPDMPPRVIVRHGDRHSQSIPFDSYREARNFARWLADKVNEACTPDAVTDGEGAGV